MRHIKLIGWLVYAKSVKSKLMDILPVQVKYINLNIRLNITYYI